jgi:hypothetical protein
MTKKQATKPAVAAKAEAEAKAAERAAANAKIAAALSVSPGMKHAPESLDTKPVAPVDPLPSELIEVTREAVSAMQGADEIVERTRSTIAGAGAMVARFYPNAAAFMDVKKQFIADAILPGLHPKHKLALERTLARKGTEEWDAMSATDKKAWEAANQAKKDARSVADTYFKRILRAAYEVKKEEKTSTLADTLAALATQWIKRLEKAEGEEGLDIPAALAGFRAVAAAVKV